MNTQPDRLAGRYLAALRTHLAQGSEVSLAPAERLGRQAARLGLGILDMAQIHERALVALVSPGHPLGDVDGMIERAGRFFRQALIPLVTAAGTAHQAGVPVVRPKAPRHPRAAELTAARQQLRRETVRRQEAEAALEKSERHYGRLLAQSQQMQKQLRHLSHQILLAQEEERKHISRELHDEISQILTGINVRLTTLRKEATVNTGGLNRRIASTQRLVEKSVAAVHRFARELRPAMLDDLGLIPTLLAHMKEFRKRAGLQIHFTTPTAGKIEQLGSLKRTVLYRIVQEALTNVAKHAQATLVRVSLQTRPGVICMEVSDNGKSFAVEDVLRAKRRRRLGLLGMRERAEMVGGTFTIDSAPGQGTTVRVRIPVRNGARE